jgi:hypothetical protein
VKKTLMFVFLLLMCNLMLFAQTEKVSRTVHTKEKSVVHVPAQKAAAGLKVIYNNLGTKTDAYYEAGVVIQGPAVDGNGYYVFIGLPFTPKANSTITQVRAAVQYQGLGANQVNLSIYGDTNGAPGTLLAGPVTVTNVPDAGTCCTLAVADFTPTAVTGGTRYWVVADTPLTGTGSDFLGVWQYVPKVVPMAVGDNNGWFPTTANDLPAGEVLGTIP